MERKESVFKGYDNIFAVRLRALMEKTGTTQQVLADKTDCTRQAIAQYTGGLNAPNVDKLVSIARYFGVSVDYLLGLTDSPTPTDNDTGKLIRSICDYTGLSEKAVVFLMKNRLNDVELSKIESEDDFGDISYLRFINHLLEYDVIDADVFLGAERYRISANAAIYRTKLLAAHMAKVIEECNQRNITYDKLSDDYYNFFHRITDIERNHRMDCIECIDAFEKILSAYIGQQEDELKKQIRQCKTELQRIQRILIELEDTNADNNEA